MDNREELLNEVDKLLSLVESAVRDHAPGREKTHMQKLKSAIRELNESYPEVEMDLEVIQSQLEDLRKIPKEESTD